MNVISRLKREVVYLSAMSRINNWLKDLAPDSKQLLPDDLEAICDRYNIRPAIIFEGKTWSYGQLDLSLDNYRLLAATAAGMFFVITRNMLWTIVFGMGVFTLLRLLLG
jgi:hypothetical protein